VIIMAEIPSCPECKVPTQVIEGHNWLNSGVIVLVVEPTLRMAFVECENFDFLFESIEKIVGLSIERLLIDIERKGTRDYFAPFISEETKRMLRSHELPFESLSKAAMTTNRMNGLGRHDMVSLRYDVEDPEGNYITTRCSEPYSLPLACGDLAGATESAQDMEYGHVTHRELAPGVYEMTAAVSSIPDGLVGRLERKQYRHREGDVELPKCSVCGGPAALSTYRWDLEKGMIRSTVNGRRVGIFHPSVLDPLFEELEEELGEVIPEAVIDAQRRFVKRGSYSADEIKDEEAFRDQLALQGIGNLRRLEKGGKSLNVRLDNVCLHLITIGTIQGLFEMETGSDSRVEWSLSEEDDLEAEFISI